MDSVEWLRAQQVIFEKDGRKDSRPRRAADEIEQLRAAQVDYQNVLKAALLEPNGVDLVNRLTQHALRARSTPTE